MVTMYSTNCPKCMVLEQKLRQNNISFELIEDSDKVIEYGREHNIKSAPILDVDGIPHDFPQALKFVNEWVG